MLGKRFRRTTSMSHLGPGTVAPVGATPAEKTQGVPIPHSVPPKAARPLIFQAQSDSEAMEERADVGFGDVNMAVTAFEAASAQVRRPACHANDGEVDRCEDAASMEVMVAGWEEDERGAIVSCNGDHESMQRSGVCYSDGVFVERSLLAGGMQSTQAHEQMMSRFQGNAPGLLLMPDQMGLWITQSSMQYGSQGHGKLEQPNICPVDFLDVCFYCKRRLRHERDIFIYRGDTAFCSEECRHRQIVKDERRSSRANGSKRGGSAAARARSSSSSETAVAA